MQNSVNFPWVNPSNFTSNSSNSNKNVWQDYQNLAADFLLKNQNLKNQNIYSPSISQLAHSNYLEKMSNLAANSNDMQLNNLNSNQSQSQLPDLNDLNSLSGLNEKWNQLPNSGHLMLSNTSSNLQSNHSSKHHSNGLAETSNLHSNSFSNHNGNSTHHHSTSGSGRKCLNKGNFLCVVCNKSFTQKGNLKTHQLIHTGTKPFICTVCGKGFTQKGNVDTHMRIHNGQKKIKKIKQKDFMNKDLNRRDDFKFNQIQRHKDNNQDMNQNQSVIDRLLPMQSLNNTNSPINFSNSHHNSASTSNWSNLANNLINNSAINKTNRNSTSSSSTSNFQSSYDDFANNLSNYNTFTQINSTHNLHHKLLEQLNQNGKNSPIQNSMQQQIDYNAIDFPLLQ